MLRSDVFRFIGREFSPDAVIRSIGIRPNTTARLGPFRRMQGLTRLWPGNDLGQELTEDWIYGKAATFSVTAQPRNGAQDSFRKTVLGMRTDDLQDCILSVFHVSESCALFSG